MPTITSGELRGLLGSFRSSLFRLETRQEYRVPAEVERIRLFLAGKPLPPRTTAAFQLVKDAVASGRRVYRVHIIEHPLTPYLRYELAAYQDSVDAGEEIYLADRSADLALADLVEDYLLFDADGDEASLVWVRYDQAGRHLGWERSDDPAELDQCRRWRDSALRHAVSLDRYLAANPSTA